MSIAPSKDLLEKIAKAISPGNHSWVYNLDNEDQDSFETAYLAHLNDGMKRLHVEAKAKVEAADERARTAAVRALVIKEIHARRVNVGDPSTDPETYRARVDTLLHNPAFSGANWREDSKGNLYPIDVNGEHLKDNDFHPVTAGDLVEQFNVFHDVDTDAGEGKPQMSFGEYTKRKNSLMRFGTKEEVLKLSQRYLSQAEGA